ncbi:MAG: hypothetical protein, partial [Olavius algarvensis Delta 4 endosymbiont]
VFQPGARPRFQWQPAACACVDVMRSKTGKSGQRHCRRPL